jgi:hypothetical protein
MSAFIPVDQHYLLLARQTQALSLAVHIPLVCFGIAFLALVLFAEWRYLRSGAAGPAPEGLSLLAEMFEAAFLAASAEDPTDAARAT